LAGINFRAIQGSLRWAFAIKIENRALKDVIEKSATINTNRFQYGFITVFIYHQYVTPYVNVASAATDVAPATQPGVRPHHDNEGLTPEKTENRY
jgi:hypothetical protein